MKLRDLLPVAVFAAGIASADPGPSGVPITIDDLATRARIVLAALSPDGRYAAYLVARGDPGSDTYKMTLTSVTTEAVPKSVQVAAYELGGSDTFNHLDHLRPAAGALYWTARNELLFTEKSAGKMRLAVWNPRDGKTRVVVQGHDSILMDDTDRLQQALKIATRDVVPNGDPRAANIVDHAWRMGDDDRFYGERPNVKTSPRIREQQWSSSVDDAGRIALVPAGAASERWERQSAWPLQPPHFAGKIVTTERETTFPYGPVASPSGRQSAFVRYRATHLDKPGENEREFGVALASEGQERQVVAPSSWGRRVLGWASELGPIYYLEWRAQETVMSSVSLRGKSAELARVPAQLEKPCDNVSRQCQIMSGDGSSALLIRSTNTTPDELVIIDLKQGSIRVLAKPNTAFESKRRPEVRFYEIENLGGKAWGRLYLPVKAPADGKSPLVITQYGSSPGFNASVGDEVPILPLAAAGIAVFAMDAGNFGRESKTGDFRMEITRVQPPLDGMRWIIEKLAGEGIIDPRRVGMTGLSYGAEIAMYAYWKSDLFAAVSTASGSWDPIHFALGGFNYAQNLRKRGLAPVGDEEGMKKWRQLAAGLNARADLPPLLIQSSDGEENFTAPTWTALRFAAAPVEWYDYPEAQSGHVKARPANRWWVYARNLDWFRFWLQDVEDSAPAKADQYARWRKMREQIEATRSQRN